MQKREISKVQMIIREFGAEVCGVLGNPKDCQQWLRNFHDGLVYGIRGRSEFADKLRNEAEAFLDKKAAAGRAGGIAKSRRAAGESADPKSLAKSVDGGSSASPAEVPDSEDLYEHVAAEGLDEFDARQWFEMCSDRGWKDRYGNPIGNWKGALKRFCDAKARRRWKEKEE